MTDCKRAASIPKDLLTILEGYPLFIPGIGQVALLSYNLCHNSTIDGLKDHELLEIEARWLNDSGVSIPDFKLYCVYYAVTTGTRVYCLIITDQHKITRCLYYVQEEMLDGNASTDQES